mmetsp:Transcript_22739/g.76867  ORF Transcript_22739/g.76867 Transcript_22739/m.76867 type:complete len:223 (+) Transcript_22739:338-1006(+)
MGADGHCRRGDGVCGALHQLLRSNVYQAQVRHGARHHGPRRERLAPTGRVVLRLRGNERGLCLRGRGHGLHRASRRWVRHSRGQVLLERRQRPQNRAISNAGLQGRRGFILGGVGLARRQRGPHDPLGQRHRRRAGARHAQHRGLWLRLARLRIPHRPGEARLCRLWGHRGRRGRVRRSNRGRPLRRRGGRLVLVDAADLALLLLRHDDHLHFIRRPVVQGD